MSCSYNITLANDEGGFNVHYDIEFLGVFTHLAIVNNPRYERANIVLNSKAVDNYNEEQKRDEKGQWVKEDFNKELDKYLQGKYTSADNLKVLSHPSKPWLEVGLENVRMYLTSATFDKATKNKRNVSEKTFRNLPNLLKDPLYIFKSSTVEGSFVGVLDDFEESKGIKKTLIAIVKPIKNKIAINLIPSVYGKDPDFPYREVFKNNLLYEKQNKKTVLNNVVAPLIKKINA